MTPAPFADDDDDGDPIDASIASIRAHRSRPRGSTRSIGDRPPPIDRLDRSSSIGTGPVVRHPSPIHARVHAHRARSIDPSSSIVTARVVARDDDDERATRARATGCHHHPSSSTRTTTLVVVPLPPPPPRVVVVVARDRARPSIVARAPERERSSKASRCTAAIRSRGRGGPRRPRAMAVGWVYILSVEWNVVCVS